MAFYPLCTQFILLGLCGRGFVTAGGRAGWGKGRQDGFNYLKITLGLFEPTDS